MDVDVGEGVTVSMEGGLRSRVLSGMGVNICSPIGVIEKWGGGGEDVLLDGNVVGEIAGGVELHAATRTATLDRKRTKVRRDLIKHLLPLFSMTLKHQG
jgi:hypothetical protein